MKFTFSDMNSASGEILEAAPVEPVSLTKRGKARLVILTAICRAARRRLVKSQVVRPTVSSFAPWLCRALCLFPITSQLFATDRLFLAISQIGCRRAGLDFPCWIILAEYNRPELDKAFDFETTTPIGSFSLAFLKAIASTVKQAAAA